jgi:hypothetical protein
MIRLLQTSAFLLCPLLFALAIFLNEFECPLTGRVMDSHNRSTKLHKDDGIDQKVQADKLKGRVYLVKIMCQIMYRRSSGRLGIGH